MLSDREVFSEWKGKIIQGTINQGCPQGGVLSPLLWILVVDELIQILDEDGVVTEGYADDFVILVSGKYEEVLPDLLEQALKKVQRWCEANSLAVNPNKTEIVVFTRKYKCKVKELITFYRRQVPYAEGVKYLGVYLDKKLYWTTHLQMQCRKVLNMFMQCRSAIGTGWGLDPQKTLWIYRAILIPKLTYAAIVWWKTTEKVTLQKELDHIQAIILRGTFRLKRSTPTAAVRMMLDEAGLDLVIKGCAAKAAYRLTCLKEWVENGMGHTTIKKMLPGGLCSAIQDKISKHILFRRRYKTIIPEREKWRKNEVLGHGDIWFTDWSKGENGTGFGICGPKRSLDSSHKLREYNTVFQAEMAAIGTCASKLLLEKVVGRVIRICTDSQASIMALETPISNSALVKEVKKTLNDLAAGNKLYITWIPGHSGYKGNARADKLAKQGAEMKAAPTREVGMPYREGCGKIDETLEKERWHNWNLTEAYR
ncbi:uncharacterized protein LOC131664172 [Phymastichus coffea]|uniref:uncharacterized protein LOC131664172 n=1 Tax=Phymastichus coffea TaxID=108790 RepID=UPI00273B3402|nr:uncharacterized protein LOC131664172 [Phymastichus coffea]